MNIVGKKIRVADAARKVDYTVTKQEDTYVYVQAEDGTVKKFLYEMVIAKAVFLDDDSAFLADLAEEKQSLDLQKKGKTIIMIDRVNKSIQAGKNKERTRKVPNHKGNTLYILMTAFSGSYIEDNGGKNIGHECVNFFLPDNSDKYYLYLNDDGHLPEDYSGYDGNITLITIAKEPKPYSYRILSKAEHCRILSANEAQNPGTVYGKAVRNIYSANMFNGQTDPADSILSTFWTEPSNVSVPVGEAICRINDNDPEADIRKNIVRGLRFYINDEAVPDTEKYLDSISWQPFDKSTGCLPGYPKTQAAYAGSSAMDRELQKFAAAAGMP